MNEMLPLVSLPRNSRVESILANKLCDNVRLRKQLSGEPVLLLAHYWTDSGDSSLEPFHSESEVDYVNNHV